MNVFIDFISDLLKLDFVPFLFLPIFIFLLSLIIVKIIRF